jgi:hypothetical protein
MGTSYGTVPQISLPSSVYELRDYIKRRLGYPVVQINVSDEQIYDRISDALQYYRDYHYDGTQRTYMKWQLSAENITNQYLPVEANVVGISRIFNPQATESSKFTSVKYKLMSEINNADVFGYMIPSYVEYVQTMQKLSEMDMIFRGLKPIRFNRNEDKLYIDMDWSYDVQEGDWIVAEGEVILDPQIYTSIFHERFILDYSSALVKMQWGENIKKFGNIQLPGGLTMEGQTLYDEGKADKDKLEEDMMTYTLPPYDLIG